VVGGLSQWDSLHNNEIPLFVATNNRNSLLWTHFPADDRSASTHLAS